MFGEGAILRRGKVWIFVAASWHEAEEYANGAEIVCILVAVRLQLTTQNRVVTELVRWL
jgi:hypothetical protein